MEKIYYTANEVAELMGVVPQTAYRVIRKLNDSGCIVRSASAAKHDVRMCTAGYGKSPGANEVEKCHE